MGTEMPQQTQGPCAECGCEYVWGLKSDERRHNKYHDRAVNGYKTRQPDGCHFVTHRSEMALQLLAQAAASEAHYETEYDFTSFSAEKTEHDEHETIAAIYVKGGRVCALIVSRKRECHWKARLQDIAEHRPNAEAIQTHKRRAVDMIWVLKNCRRQGIAKRIVRAMAEHCKVSVEDLAHLTPLSTDAINLWHSLRLTTIYLAH